MPSTEKRTQIYLTASQHRAAMTLARRRGGSLAGVVRDALDRYLDDAGHEADVSWDGDPAFALIGTLVLPDPADRGPLSEYIDQTVYEEGTGSWSSPTAPASSPPSTRATPRTRRRRRRGVRSRKGVSGSSRRSSS